MRQVSIADALANDVVGQPHESASQVSVEPTENILFLQGPVGPFFSRVAKDFTQRGFNVHKINFNGGDKFFYRHDNAVDYEGTPEQWSDYLETFVEKNAISRIYVFGDCRFYHREARKITDEQGIDLYVFEEGYIRPNHITLERGGVNGFSPLMNGPVLVNVSPSSDDAPVAAGRFGFLIPAVFSMIYYLAASFYSSTFSSYVHHRPFGCLSEGAIWIRSGFRKVINRGRGRQVVKTLSTRFQNQYFLCPLQVHCDMQVVVHSSFESIDQFICEVMTSFAKSAPKNHALVFKHHPLDRGYTNYRALIDELARALHIDERVFYVHDVCLPAMLRNAEGSVMINSTVGMSSFYHGTPVKVLGDAIYDRKGLTYQGPLESFWQDPGEVDVDAVDRFRSFLVRTNQLNGNLYKRCVKDSAAGVVWSGKLLSEHSPVQVEKPAAAVVVERRVRLIAGKDVEAANCALRSKPIDGFSKTA